MPTSEPIPAGYPSDEQLLAALDRAARHLQRPGALLSVLKQHLDLPRDGWATRRLLPQLEALQATGQIERARYRGLTLWHLMPAGEKRLAAAQAAGQVGPLPESPQHQCWREARIIADERIEQYGVDLRCLLAEVNSLISAEPPAASERWIELGDRLHHACHRYGSALYCLHEWIEPDDARADVEQSAYLGRRTFWL